MLSWQVWMQLKTAYVSKESLVLGRGELVWDPRKIARNYLFPLSGFAFDVYIILPVPQVWGSWYVNASSDWFLLRYNNYFCCVYHGQIVITQVHTIQRIIFTNFGYCLPRLCYGWSLHGWLRAEEILWNASHSFLSPSWYNICPKWCIQLWWCGDCNM